MVGGRLRGRSDRAENRVARDANGVTPGYMGSATNGSDERCSVVAVGASAGGVEALKDLAAGLPRDLGSALLVVLHMPAGAASVLAKILDRSGPLEAVTATHGDALLPGRIYVAVPDKHLMVYDSQVVLSDGPTENGHRPAINALFGRWLWRTGRARSAC